MAQEMYSCLIQKEMAAMSAPLYVPFLIYALIIVRYEFKKKYVSLTLVTA